MYPSEDSLAVGAIDVRVLTRGQSHSNDGGLSWYTDGADLQAELAAVWPPGRHIASPR